MASRVKTRLRDEKDTGEDRAFKAARLVVPKNPHFVSVFSQYSRYAVVSEFQIFFILCILCLLRKLIIYFHYKKKKVRKSCFKYLCKDN